MTDPFDRARGRAAASPALPVDEAFFADIHGTPQWLTIHGADRADPALLIVSGAGFALSSLADYFAPWTGCFTLAHWDQPGAGRTFARNGRPNELGLDGLVRDGVAVVEALLARLGQARLVLMGVSGGSTVALLMLKARPELFSAYVGVGQVTNWARQAARSYQLILERARTSGEEAAVAEIEAVGPPPWPDVAGDIVRAKYANAMTAAEQAAFAEADLSALAPVPGRPDARALSLDAFVRLKPELEAFDARVLGRSFEIPMVFLQGVEDLYTVYSEIDAYAAELSAPAVVCEAVEGGGHMSLFLREAMLALLERHVSPRIQSD